MFENVGEGGELTFHLTEGSVEHVGLVEDEDFDDEKKTHTAHCI